MTAYKFLRAGAVGPFSGYAWPTPRNGAPGPWVGARDSLETCRSGVHACGSEDLPFWLDDELWKVELGGAVREDENVIVAERGRLLARVGAWDTRAALAFAQACAERTRAFAQRRGDERLAGYVEDVEYYGAKDADAKLASPIAFVAAGAAEAAWPGGFEEERAWQAAWLANRLAL